MLWMICWHRQQWSWWNSDAEAFERSDAVNESLQPLAVSDVQCPVVFDGTASSTHLQEKTSKNGGDIKLTWKKRNVSFSFQKRTLVVIDFLRLRRRRVLTTRVVQADKNDDNMTQYRKFWQVYKWFVDGLARTWPVLWKFGIRVTRENEAGAVHFCARTWAWKYETTCIYATCNITGSVCAF